MNFEFWAKKAKFPDKYNGRKCAVLPEVLPHVAD